MTAASKEVQGFIGLSGTFWDILGYPRIKTKFAENIGLYDMTSELKEVQGFQIIWDYLGHIPACNTAMRIVGIFISKMCLFQ